MGVGEKMRTFIKIFNANNDTGILESEINEFIKDKEIIDIKYSISSYAMCNEYSSTEGTDYSALLIYKIRREKRWQKIYKMFFLRLYMI